MKNAHKRWGLGAALILVAGSLLTMAAPTAASAAPQSPNACGLQPRSGHIAGIVPAVGTCPDPAAARLATTILGSNTHFRPNPNTYAKT